MILVVEVVVVVVVAAVVEVVVVVQDICTGALPLYVEVGSSTSVPPQ